MRSLFAYCPLAFGSLSTRYSLTICCVKVDGDENAIDRTNFVKFCSRICKLECHGILDSEAMSSSGLEWDDAIGGEDPKVPAVPAV